MGGKISQSDERQRTLDRILKILALASGSSFEAEAATARAMAERLIANHNIELSEDQKNARDQIVAKTYVPWGKKWLWERIIAAAVSKLCGCAFFWSGEADIGDGYVSFDIVGTAAAVEACLYVLDQVQLQRQRAWTTYKGEGGEDGFGKFCFSFARGLEAKIPRLVGESQLAEAKRANIWFQKQYHVVEGDHIKGRGSSDAGLAAGDGASLHRGAMAAKGPQQRIAGPG